MGKVNLAFDHITEKEQIKELSVVIYTDSFFYGLWSKDGLLLKTGYHPFESLSSLCELWVYFYNFDQINLMSAVRPFVHLPAPAYKKRYFDIYFSGLYDLNQVDNHLKKSDKNKFENIRTLHYVPTSILEVFKSYKLSKIKLSHISNAMINYLHQHTIDLVFYSANKKLHVGLFEEQGFRLYNQYDCYYETDYLYFTQMILHEFDLKNSETNISYAGDLRDNLDVMPLLNKYSPRIHFVKPEIRTRTKLANATTNYYDLHLCKTCV